MWCLEGANSQLDSLSSLERSCLTSHSAESSGSGNNIDSSSFEHTWMYNGDIAGGVRKGRDQSVEMVKKGGGGSINPAEVAAMDVLLSRQLLEGLVCLLAEVPLL